MTKKLRAHHCVQALKKEYPDAICSLTYKSPFELLISVRLAAQCTDARVNMITPALFDKYKTLDDYIDADVTDVEEIIRSCGFFFFFSLDIIGMAAMMEDNFDGIVPDNMEDLLTLPGVGRKTANLILGDVYGKPAIVCDTHLIRIANRLGLVKTKNPHIVERELAPILDPAESSDFCHRCVLHGRAVCTARKAMCYKCCMSDYCKKVI
ncbi:MAG: endonuclease III [Oscillospiraceae bacterium]|nr:endonuclease III [Oscillospiraceae bacterium]